MANTIQIKRGEDINNAPALFDGELAFDQKDDQLYIGKNGEKIQVAPSKQEHDALL